MEAAERDREGERHGPIGPFLGEWFFLSNFAPAAVVLDGLPYPSVEHAYQAARCATASDRDLIRRARTPGEAKRLGRAATQVANWPAVRERVMSDLLAQKFSGPELRERLLSTGDRPIVEENSWGDTFWGTVGGVGDNRLGLLLEQLRSELRATRAGPHPESGG